MGIVSASFAGTPFHIFAVLFCVFFFSLLFFGEGPSFDFVCVRPIVLATIALGVLVHAFLNNALT